MKKIFLFLAVFCAALLAKDDATWLKKDLVLTSEAIRTLDSSKATDLASFNIISNVQETLLLHKGGKLVPGAALSYEVSKDALTYTFHLRKNLFWSDGVKLTSADYAYAFKRLLDPKEGSSYAFLLFGLKNAKKYYAGKTSFANVGVKAPNERTLIINLEYKLPYFPQLVAFGSLSPQRKDYVEKYANTFATQPDKMPYSGPFVVSSWVRGSKIELKKNPFYYNAQSTFLDAVKFLEVKEYSTKYQMFRYGQLDAVEGGNVEFIKRYNVGALEGRYQHINKPLARQYFLTFNFNKPEFKSKKVRLAFSASLNRQEFVNKVLGTGIAAYGFVTPGIYVGNINYRKAVSGPLKKLDVKDVKALLIQGLKDLQMDANPAKHTFTLLQRGSDTQSKLEGEYIKNTWEKALGVRIKLITPADFASYLETNNAGRFEISYQGWGADYNSPLSFLDYFATFNSYNSGHYASKKVDALIKQAQVQDDEYKRLEYFKQIEEIITLKNPACAPLYYQDLNIYIKNFVHGLEFSLFGGQYQLRWVWLK